MSQEIREKINRTLILKYDSLDNFYKNSIAKRNKTILTKYGDYATYYAQLVFKQQETKRKNNSWSKSQAEEYLFNFLTDIFGDADIIRQYFDKRYPYRCDFYIKSLDLFIEVNMFWTHGPHPFDPENPEDIELLEQWQSRQNTYINHKGYKIKNQFYGAVDTWTRRDVQKIATAEINNLNYIMLYNKGDIDAFIRRIQEKFI